MPPAARDAAIRGGSKSFALASRLFDAATREHVWDLYTWCRHCDDVIDGQVLGHPIHAVADGRDRLRGLRLATAAAFDGETAPGSPFAALGRVASRTSLPRRLAEDHLAGFAMDVESRRYDTIDDTLDYGYHVAGAVGLMMAWVMGVRDPAVLCRASDLGIAFQLTNIARDVAADADAGRVYLPGAWLADAQARVDAGFTHDRAAAARVAAVVARLLSEADRYYRSAWYGIADLPLRSAWAVATARLVYRAIGRRVAARGDAAWTSRAVVSTPRKLGFVALATVQVAWLAITRRLVVCPERSGLYTPAAVGVLR